MTDPTESADENYNQENMQNLVDLYKYKYEHYLDQNRRVRSQSVLVLGVTTTAFALLLPSVKLDSEAEWICFTIAMLVFVAQALLSLFLYFPYDSRQVTDDDWDKDWETFVTPTRREHLTVLASVWLDCIESEKVELAKRSVGYYVLLTTSVICPVLLLVIFAINQAPMSTP